MKETCYRVKIGCRLKKRFWKGGKTVPKGGGKRNLEGEEKVSRVRKRGW